LWFTQHAAVVFSAVIQQTALFDARSLVMKKPGKHVLQARDKARGSGMINM
jgi:hypothetical protein